MALSASLRRKHARVAILARWHGRDSALFQAAHAEYEAEKLAEAMRQLATLRPDVVRAAFPDGLAS